MGNLKNSDVSGKAGGRKGGCADGIEGKFEGGFPAAGQEKAGGFRRDVRAMASLAMLVAVEIVLSRFLSISAWNVKIGFSFVPVVLAGILYGPLPAGVVGALGDFLGAILFPIGPYFPGFTLTAFLTGAVFGLFLHKKRSLPRTMAAVGINQFVLSLFVNTLWISLLYGSPYGPLLATRFFQALLLAVAQFAVIRMLLALPSRFLRQAADAVDG